MKPVLACLALAAAAAFSIASAQAQAPAVAASAPAPAPAAMPDPGHPWQPAEFNAAAAAMVAGVEPLPSYATPRGKAVLARYLSSENFAPLSDPSVPLKSRATEANSMMVSAGHVFKLYGSTPASMHAETTGVVAIMLRYTALNAILLQQYLVTQDPLGKNPKIPAMRQQLGTVFEATDENMLAVIDVPDYFTPADKSMLISTLATTLSPLKVFYDAPLRARLRARIAEHRAAATDPKDQQNYDLAIHELDS